MTHSRERKLGRLVSGIMGTAAVLAVVLSGAVPAAKAAFPGTNGKIAFVRDGDIWTIKPDGSGAMQLTNHPFFEFDPAWSPDGQRVVFSRGHDIWVMKGDGTEQEPVTAGDAVDFNPTWAPDGQRIAFERSGEIFVVKDDGTGLENVTNHPDFDGDPAWSPDGTKIAFTTSRDNTEVVEDGGEIYTIDLATSAVRRLTNNAGDDNAPGPADRHPAWSPDGRRIAFDSQRAGIRGSRIYIMSASGTGERMVPTGDLSAFDASWSPEGQGIVFTGVTEIPVNPFVVVDLYVVTGTGIEQLTDAPGGEGVPDWGPLPDTDGDALPDAWETTAFDSDGDGNVDLDLPAMGADPDHKDIFVEVDWMTGHELEQAAIDIVVASFAAAPVPNPDGTTGIRLHVDNGSNSTMDPVTGGTWGSLSKSNSIGHDTVLGTSPDPNSYDWGEFETLKRANFEEARARAFHYVISAHQYGSAANDSSGYARIVGADVIVSLGALCPPPAAECSGTVEQQAGTFMHELGHNLGLHHGGQDAVNRKPNYFSVMNYEFQFTGLVSQLGNPGFFDYSAFGPASIGPLDENELDEADGFGAVAANLPYYTIYRCPDGRLVEARPVDNLQVNWNCDGSLGGVFAVDITGMEGLGVLNAYEDWPNLVYGGGAIGNASGVDVDVPALTPLFEPSVVEILEAAELLTGGGGDTLAPVTTASAAPAPNAAGWNRDTVTVDLSATDEGSGVRELVYSTGGPQATVAGDSASVEIAAEGVTTLTFFARDEAGNEEAPQTLVVRIDRTAPALTCSVSPNRLWPPNHKLVSVQASVELGDALSGGAGFSLLSVTSNEPDNGQGDGDIAIDIQEFVPGTADTAGMLRAERSGKGQGRVYTLTYEATDRAGNTSSCAPTVVVPKSNG